MPIRAEEGGNCHKRTPRVLLFSRCRLSPWNALTLPGTAECRSAPFPMTDDRPLCSGDRRRAPGRALGRRRPAVVSRLLKIPRKHKFQALSATKCERARSPPPHVFEHSDRPTCFQTNVLPLGWRRAPRRCGGSVGALASIACSSPAPCLCLPWLSSEPVALPDRRLCCDLCPCWRRRFGRPPVRADRVKSQWSIMKEALASKNDSLYDAQTRLFPFQHRRPASCAMGAVRRRFESETTPHESGASKSFASKAKESTGLVQQQQKKRGGRN